MSEKYNGWTNYETWAVNLWMSNDEVSASYWDEKADECLTEAKDEQLSSKEQNATHALKEAIKDEFEDGKETVLPEASVYSDLLGAALSEVNWYEIAKGLIDEAVKRADENKESEAD